MQMTIVQAFEMHFFHSFLLNYKHKHVLKFVFLRLNKKISTGKVRSLFKFQVAVILRKVTRFL